MRHATTAVVGGIVGAVTVAAVTIIGLRIASNAHADSIAPDLSGLATTTALQNEAATARAAESNVASVAAAASNAASSAGTTATAAQATANAASTAAQSAQSAASAASTLVTSVQNSVSSVQSDYGGTTTRAAMPSASANPYKRIVVTDAGGGPAEFQSLNGCWVRTGSPLNAAPPSVPIPVATTINIDGIASTPNMILGGSGMSTKATIVMTNSCSMPGLVLSYPAGVFSATGALSFAGLNAGAPAVSVGGVGVTSSFGVYSLMPGGGNYQRTMGPTLP